ncbi:MAG: type II toxin-antitoxin system PemK/MazF family toxin [Bacteroidota bacterium]
MKWLQQQSKGKEQSGIRPALVLSVDFFNYGSAGLAVVIPITSKKKGIPLHIPVSGKETGLKVESFVKCEDIRSISKDRFIEYRGHITNSPYAAEVFFNEILTK